MALPTITFRFTGMNSDASLQTLAENKLQSLQKFTADEEATIAVEFRKDAAQQTGEVFVVEANMNIGGTLYRASATEASFEIGIDEVRNELDKEIRRTRNKKEGFIRRGGRKLKDMMRFGK